MKIKEIRSLDNKALADKVGEMRKELLKLNAQIAVGTSIKNPGQVKKIKRSIARILTVQAQKAGGSKKI